MTKTSLKFQKINLLKPRPENKFSCKTLKLKELLFLALPEI